MSEKAAKTSEELFRDCITMISPGTKLRAAISSILQAHTGGLMCFGSPKRLAELSEGGIQIDAPCTPQLLFELSKMDGAILLNSDGTKILFANRFLKPDSGLPSNETGTRHRAAERMARQAKCMAIAVSERRSSVTLFVHGRKYQLDNIATLLNKASQAIQTMEKYLSGLNQALIDLTTREFQDMVTIVDVCKVIQRCEMVLRIGGEIEPYILELGEEGRLIELQLNELLMPIEEAQLVVKDYYRDRTKGNLEAVRGKLAELDEKELLNLGSISFSLGYGTNIRSVDTYLSPRGYRVLAQTNRLSEQVIENLIERYATLQQIMRAPKEDLVQVDGVGEVLAERVRVGLNLLQNQLALSRR